MKEKKKRLHAIRNIGGKHLLSQYSTTVSYHRVSKKQQSFLIKKLPRAIICAYDYMAIGAISCIYEHGLSVPYDIAVLGMDDIPQEKFLNPPLASIYVPSEQLCRIATENLIKRINGEKTDNTSIINADFKLRKFFEIT